MSEKQATNALERKGDQPEFKRIRWWNEEVRHTQITEEKPEILK